MTILQEYDDKHLPEKLRTAPTSAAARAAKYKEEETEWKKRQRKEDQSFSSVRESNRNLVIAETVDIFNGICNQCRNHVGSIVCHDCHYLLCAECDSAYHLKHITHDRVVLLEKVIHKLKSTEYVDSNGKVEKRGRLCITFDQLYY